MQLAEIGIELERSMNYTSLSSRAEGFRHNSTFLFQGVSMQVRRHVGVCRFCTKSLLLLGMLIGGCAAEPGTGEPRMTVAPSPQTENSTPPQAAESKPKVEPPGPVETVRLKKFNNGYIVKQERGVWCWAACAQMVHRINSRQNVTQEQIVARILGRSKLGGSGKAEESTAQLEEVLAALNPRVWEIVEKRDARRAEQEKNRAGKPDNWRINYLALLVGEPWPDADPEKLIEGLKEQQPVIVAWNKPVKHICMVIEVTYRRERVPGLFNIPVERTRLVSVTFVDPARNAPDIVTITGEEFKERADFVATVATAREYFRVVSQTSKIPFIVPKGAKGRLIETDFSEAMKKARELNKRLREGKSI